MRYTKLFIAAVATLALGGCLTFNVGQAGPQDATGNTSATGNAGETGRTGAKSTSGDAVAIVPLR